MKKQTKRKLNFETYKKLLSYTCAHPECTSGVGIEAHHIRPLYKGGEDAFWNIISLCWVCHHKKKMHSKSEEKITELYVYKSMHESEKLGFYCDEKEEGFKEKFKVAVKENKKFTDEDIFLANKLLG